MSSQLNVDTIVDKAGSGESNVKIANTSVTVAEGGSATTTTVQGLCKFFSNIIGTSTISTRDSFNQSGITDIGTGDYKFSFTNNMGNDDYATMVGCDSSSNHLAMHYSEGEQHTTDCRCFVLELSNASATDSAVVMMSINGDLA